MGIHGIAKLFKFSVNGSFPERCRERELVQKDVDVFRKTLDQIPAFRKARAAFEDDPRRNGRWLSTSTTAGASQAGQAGSTVDVRVEPTGLTPGDYYGQIEVRSPSAPNSPQSITVVLSVLEAGVNTGVAVRPMGLVFTSGTPQSLTLTSGTAVDFNASAAFPGGDAWFFLQPLAGRIAPGTPAVVNVNPNIAGLAAGICDASITFKYSDGSSQPVDLLLVIAATGSSAGKQSRGADGCTPSRLPCWRQHSDRLSRRRRDSRHRSK